MPRSAFLRLLVLIGACSPLALPSFACGHAETSLCPKRDPHAYPIHLTADLGSVMALFNDGTAWCWGDAGLGECSGLPTFHTTPSRTDITCASGLTRGGDGGVLRRFDGGVEVWSQNQFGQLADGGTPVGTDNAPMLIQGLFDGVEVASSATAEFTLQAGGTVEWWGTLPITDATSAAEPKPTPMRGLPPIQAISANDHVCALSKAGQVFCWGNNDLGQLGDGTTDSRATPGLVSNLEDVTSIAAGNGYSCAVDRAGVVSCWGLSDHGLLGRGDALSPPSQFHFHDPTPAPVVSLPPCKAVAAGEGFACALSNDGVPYCWGAVGGVAPDVKFPSSTPITIDGLDSVSELALGTEYLCALKTDHTVWCVGEGSGKGHDGFDLEELTFQ